MDSYPLSGLGNTNPLLLRLRRYVKEIGEAVSKVTEGGVTSEDCNVLLSAEKHLTLSGAQRQIAQAQARIRELESLVRELEQKARESDELPALRKSLECLKQDRNDLQTKVAQLQEESRRTVDEHTERFNALHRLFEELTVQSDKNILLCEKRRALIESLETERDALKEKLTTLETHYATTTETLKKLQDTDAAKLREVTDQLTLERETIAALRREHASTLATMQQQQDKTAAYVKQLEAKNDQLEKELGERDRLAEQRAADANAAAASLVSEEELASLRHSQEEAQTLRNQCSELQASLTAVKAELTSLQEATAQASSARLDTRELRNQLSQWQNAASAQEKAGVTISPAQLKMLLMSINSWKAKATEEIEQCRQTESQLLMDISSLRDELQLVTMDQHEQRERRQAAELEANLASGALQSHKEWMARWKRQRDDENLHQEDETVYPAIFDVSKMLTAFATEKEKLLKLVTDTRQRAELLATEKQQHIEKAQTACRNFKKLEKMMETLTSEHKEAVSLLAEQKKTLESLRERIRTLESSPGYERLELLRKERDEALHLAEMTRVFYRNEAIVFRAIIRALFGWQIRIDMAPPGEEITVTLQPGFDRGDDDAALVFRVPSKLPSVPLTDLPPSAIEAEINQLYSDEDFDMHLDGRFAEKWEKDQNWKNQLSARCSYAAFLAVTILSEQNQVLQRNALLTASRVRSAYNQQRRQQQKHQLQEQREDVTRDDDAAYP